MYCVRYNMRPARRRNKLQNQPTQPHTKSHPHPQNTLTHDQCRSKTRINSGQTFLSKDSSHHGKGPERRCGCTIAVKITAGGSGRAQQLTRHVIKIRHTAFGQGAFHLTIEQNKRPTTTRTRYHSTRDPTTCCGGSLLVQNGCC